MTLPTNVQDPSTAAPKVERCAIYARYSSDMQRESSIEDQIRKCREYAAKQGWIVLDDYIFYDQAISGSKFDERAALQRLLVAAEQRPRPFELVLIDDTSRLARNVEDALYSVKVLDFNGVELVSVSQGLRSSNQSAREMFTMFGMMDERFLRDLAYKVLRGQEGCVEVGYIAGGRCYGYRNVPVEDPTRRGDYGRPFVIGVKRVIEPEEAAIVGRIFEMYASGMSLDRIACTLRAEGVPAPRPPRRNSIRAWSGDGIGEMLRNPIYIGQYIFRRTITAQDPKTRKMVARPLPESEWKRREHPEWRIVSDGLWNKVQVQRALRNRLGARKLGGLERTKRSQKYLLGGLLFCGAALPDAPDRVCGRPITVVDTAHAGKSVRYGCGAHRYKGACTNSLTIHRDRLEEQVLRWLTNDLLEGDRLDRAIAAFSANVQGRLAELQAEARKNAVNVPALRKELAGKKQEAWNLTDSIVASGRQALATVQARLIAAEARISEIENILARTGEPEPEIAVTPAEVRNLLCGKLRDLQSVLTSEPLVAKQVLRKHIKRITLTPGIVEGKRVFYAAMEFELSAGNSDVVLNGSVDALSQQYGFSTITVPGPTLHAGRVWKKGPKGESGQNIGSVSCTHEEPPYVDESVSAKA